MSATAFVAPGWLEAHLDDPGVRIIEASVEQASYDEAHIPGALWVDHYADLLRSGDDSNGTVLAPAQFSALMARLGITPATTVIAYGDRHSSYAMRLFWTLEAYGHPGRFAVLEGGRERWLAEGRPTSAAVVLPPPAIYPVPSGPAADRHATWRDVREAISSEGSVVLDVRSQEEYDGTVVRARHGGHVPGAAHVEWTDATAGDNVLQDAADLRGLYEAQGVTPDKHIITYCQLGIRAAHTWFVLKHVLGYPDVSLYDASWSEWGNRDDTPVER